MNLAGIKLTSFYSYFRAPDGTKHKVPSKETPAADWVSITKEEFENVDQQQVVHSDDSGTDHSQHADPVQESPVSGGSLVPIDTLTGVTDSFGPADFQVLLRNLDQLVGEQTGIGQLQLDIVRKYVSEIMVTLKENPEFEPILVDKDVHNVMVFVQSSMNLATADFVQKKQKKDTSAAKKAAKTGGNMTFSMIAFESEGPKGGMDFGAAFAGNAIDLGSMNLDEVQPKNRGGK